MALELISASNPGGVVVYGAACFTCLGMGLIPTLCEALSKFLKVSFLVEEILVNAEVS